MHQGIEILRIRVANSRPKNGLESAEIAARFIDAKLNLINSLVSHSDHQSESKP